LCLILKLNRAPCRVRVGEDDEPKARIETRRTSTSVRTKRIVRDPTDVNGFSSLVPLLVVAGSDGEDEGRGQVVERLNACFPNSWFRNTLYVNP
jgi:hypothetical protein